MSEIHEVHARLIADHSGRPAIEAEVVLKSGIVGTASCPALEKVSEKDIHDVLNSIAPELEGLDIIDQMELDRSIREAAGDADNGTLFAVSLACARAAAEFLPKHQRSECRRHHSVALYRSDVFYILRQSRKNR